eukprot:UN00583
MLLLKQMTQMQYIVTTYHISGNRYFKRTLKAYFHLTYMVQHVQTH